MLSQHYIARYCRKPQTTKPLAGSCHFGVVSDVTYAECPCPIDKLASAHLLYAHVP